MPQGPQASARLEAPKASPLRQANQLCRELSVVTNRCGRSWCLLVPGALAVPGLCMRTARVNTTLGHDRPDASPAKAPGADLFFVLGSQRLVFADSFIPRPMFECLVGAVPIPHVELTI